MRDGGFYGWPYSYYGQHVDARVEPPRPDLVAKAIVPDYALGPHTASLGLAYSTSNALTSHVPARHVRRPARFVEPQAAQRLQGDLRAFRRTAVRPGRRVDVLTGFLDDERDVAYGRPVGVALDAEGGLLVADDVGNAVWRVTSGEQ